MVSDRLSLFDLFTLVSN